jgi:hypothetical protein
MRVVAAAIARFTGLATWRPGQRRLMEGISMRQGRWIAVAAGVAAAVALVAPAGAGVKSAASDKAILKAAVITAADVPSTWMSAKQTDSGSKGYKGVAVCKPIAAAIDAAQRQPRAHSPEFSDPATTALAENTVYALKSVKAAQQYIAPFQASNAGTCFAQVLTKASKSGGQATATPITDLQGVGDASVGYELSFNVTDQNGQPVHLIADVIAVRVGRALVGFDFLNTDVRIPTGAAIVQAVVSRLTSAVGG